jgi:hypothetical protein
MTSQDHEENPNRIIKKARKSKHRRPPLPGGFSTKNSYTSPKRIEARKRQAEALTLRAAGASYASIGKHLNVSPHHACRMVFKAMDQMIPVETAERVRVLELARLDAIQSKLWPDCLGGRMASIHAYLRLCETRHRLMGLYPASGQQVQLNLPDAAVDGIAISFVTPQHKLSPSPVDTSPSPYAGQKPDLSRPALAPPPERRRGPLGWLEEGPAKPGDWMR